MVQPTANSSGTAGDISMREWICWDHETATEPTSTLVLTSPTNAFVDVRLIIAAAEPLLPNAGGPASRLDWAFAGVSETLPPRELSRTQHDSTYAPLLPVDLAPFCVRNARGEAVVRVPRKRWRHAIDSKYLNPDEEPAADEGVMYPVQRAAPGDPERCLEIGRMERVKGSGVAVGYQELWVTLEAMPIVGERKRRGAVISLDMPELRARGSIIRVAQFVQALLIIDQEVVVERWEYCSGSKGSEWRRVAKLGDRFLPCAWTFEGGRAMLDETTVGSELVDGEMHWKLQEKFEW